MKKFIEDFRVLRHSGQGKEEFIVRRNYYEDGPRVTLIKKYNKFYIVVDDDVDGEWIPIDFFGSFKTEDEALDYLNATIKKDEA